MADDAGSWAALAQWVLSNPEKGALFLVVLAGAWRWLRELRNSARDDGDRETLMETLIRENRELRSELREERRRKRRGEEENSGRPT